LELFTLKKRSFSALLVAGLLLATATLAMTGCGHKIYYYPEYNYAGRPIPPSGLLQRVMASYTTGSASGGLEILDGLRDLRGNIQNTVKSFSISGYSNSDPLQIINFPEETTGYVLGYTDGSLTTINYSKETSSGAAAGFGSTTPSAAAAPNGTIFAGAAEQAGLLVVTSTLGSFSLNLPNVYKVAIDQGNSVVLAMVRNSNTLYRVVKLPASTVPTVPPGSVDCEPLLLPIYCVVPVTGTYDRPVGAYFSIDGSTAYILNSGAENGGQTSSVEFLQMAQLNINSVPTVNPLSAGAPSPLTTLPVANPVPIPGGATVALSDSNYLYVAGQQLQTSGAYSGLFAGNLTLLNLSTYKAGTPISISDGSHTRLLFADNGVNVGTTLWIASTQCANGVRAAVAAQELATTGKTDQAGNYNCLSSVVLTPGTTGTFTAPTTASIVPAVVQATNVTNATPVLYPNTDQNQYYYGSATGICWVQLYGKVYTAYGGQIHAFNTLDNSEINNYNITIQGTVLDVAYMDALTNSTN
jgi:hypothetical protein